MVIKASSGKQIVALVSDLSADNGARRETAVVRLTVIGACAVTGKGKGGTLWSSAGGRAMDRALEKIVQYVAPDK